MYQMVKTPKIDSISQLRVIEKSLCHKGDAEPIRDLLLLHFVKNNSLTGIKLISLASKISETVKIQQKARGRETCSMVSPMFLWSPGFCCWVWGLRWRQSSKMAVIATRGVPLPSTPPDRRTAESTMNSDSESRRWSTFPCPMFKIHLSLNFVNSHSLLISLT